MLSRRSILRALGFGAPAAAVAAAVLKDDPTDRLFAEQMAIMRRHIATGYLSAIEASMGETTAGQLRVSGVNKPLDEISSLDGKLVINFKTSTITAHS